MHFDGVTISKPLVPSVRERASQEQSRSTRITLHDCRGRKRMKASEQSDDGASAPAGGATETMQVDDVIATVSILDCINVDLVRTPIITDTFIIS
ncbi:hypothetical protein EVAR_17034_1 [Eumeta japonica]|uniref:Uncharacterized protein n=1 Tax=Eumeta variegata TaxID=151549 RepID=A0A4C1V4H8_EUMVA|nr:hypothetical protein EVAR_17034_1 [Eumeta japonica]